MADFLMADLKEFIEASCLTSSTNKKIEKYTTTKNSRYQQTERNQTSDIIKSDITLCIYKDETGF
jgi:hypothetical protein